MASRSVLLISLLAVLSACVDSPRSTAFNPQLADAAISDGRASDDGGSDRAMGDSNLGNASDAEWTALDLGAPDAGRQASVPPAAILGWDFHKLVDAETTLVSQGAWPDFRLELADHGTAIEDNGLRFTTSESVARLRGETSRITRQIVQRAEFSVAVVFATDGSPQATESHRAPARIFTWSADTSERNLTIGQRGRDIEIRMRVNRSTSAYLNGLLPETMEGGSRTPVIATSGEVLANDPDTTAEMRWVHLVLRFHHEEGLSLWIDGRAYEPSAIGREAIGAGIDNWDVSFGLALGNELIAAEASEAGRESGLRPWSGIIRAFALYDVAIPVTEIGRSFERGELPNPDP